MNGFQPFDPSGFLYGSDGNPIHREPLLSSSMARPMMSPEGSSRSTVQMSNFCRMSFGFDTATEACFFGR